MIAALVCTAIFVGCCLAICTLDEANTTLWDDPDE